eukprot:SAG11_NODE_17571_length_514_cov_1.402410_1_plen_90_part_10
MKTFFSTILFVLGGGACAAAGAAAFMTAFAGITAHESDESTSVGRGAFCLLFPRGSGGRAAPPSDTGYASELHAADVLSMTNLTGGAATA